jgi:hypothetical protein
VLDEVLLVFVQLLPVLEILSKIDFFCGPEACHLFFVHFPDVVVLDWKDDEPVWVLLQERLSQKLLSLAYLGEALLSNSNICIYRYLRIDSSVLTVVVVDQLRAQLTDDGAWLFELSLLGGGDLLLLALVDFILRKDLCDLLLVSCHEKLKGKIKLISKKLAPMVKYR